MIGPSLLGTSTSPEHTNQMSDTQSVAPQRRRSSITEYSQIFSQAGPKPSSFINQPRHPSLSMRHDRTTSIGKLGVNVAVLTSTVNEDAIDDSEYTCNPSSTSAGQSMVGQQRGKTDDPVTIGRRLSLGARAIMYNGNRLRGDSVASGDRSSLMRSISSGSGVSGSPRSPTIDFDEKSPSNTERLPVETPADAAKQIKRRMSPTGERMLRGELAFH